MYTHGASLITNPLRGEVGLRHDDTHTRPHAICGSSQISHFVELILRQQGYLFPLFSPTTTTNKTDDNFNCNYARAHARIGRVCVCVCVLYVVYACRVAALEKQVSLLYERYVYLKTNRL
jgi:hypothetical protein